RINGFTYVQTKFDYYTGELNVVKETAYSDGPRAKVKCYGA
ncbi:MAG TPA: GGGtGRT protein, partial [Paraprevotella xylaniphila]|nr:GGGtGRT protein [Paraprevotella xylaniphila]